MINSIDIKNFETHLNTTFDLHQGVNVLIGESDEGKSGIVRAIKWNARNRPRGDSYRNDQLDPKKKEDKLKATEVGIVYKESGLVVRARDGFPGGVNHYVIDTQEPLRALGTDVPDEVQEVTRMKDVNIQGQHPTEQYFLLADKPGQVAKEFNKVAGLTIMDKASSEINSQVRDCNSEIKVAKKEIDTREGELKESKWLLEAEKFANKLKKFEVKLNKKNKEWETINEAVTLISNIDLKLEKCGRIDEAKKEIKMLIKQNQAIVDKKQEQTAINDLISAMIDIDSKLSAYTDIDKALRTLKTLNLERKKIEKLKKEHKELDYILCMLEKNKTENTEADIALIDAQKEYMKIRREEECPTCGRMGI